MDRWWPPTATRCGRRGRWWRRGWRDDRAVLETPPQRRPPSIRSSTSSLAKEKTSDDHQAQRRLHHRPEQVRGSSLLRQQARAEEWPGPQAAILPLADG